jgi:hypothetical protein
VGDYLTSAQDNAVTDQNPVKYFAAGIAKSISDIGISLTKEVNLAQLKEAGALRLIEGIKPL